MNKRNGSNGRERHLILGGAGFIGCNLAHHLLDTGHDVRVLDNLTRQGSRTNLTWLSRAHGARLEPVVGDVRNRAAVSAAVEGIDVVYHLAAQCSVRHSLEDPFHDFEVNAVGTMHVLEAIRQQPRRPVLIYASSANVYGDLSDLQLTESVHSYRPADLSLGTFGIDESRRLDPQTPFACSKAAAEQHVLQYAHSFALPATVLRLGSVYGPHQHGNEEQGFLAHFMKSVMADKRIHVHGNGKQVRDLLHVDDMVDALLRARDGISALSGRAFNVGGGMDRSASIGDLVSLVEQLLGARAKRVAAPWRAGDQRWYVSDTTAFCEAAGWRPRVGMAEGLKSLHRWLTTRTRRSARRTPDALQKGA